jgi:hypothetical protein
MPRRELCLGRAEIVRMWRTRQDVTFFIEAFFPLSYVLLYFLNKAAVHIMLPLDSPPGGGGRQHRLCEHKSHVCYSTGSGERVQI